ncbi:hypothetical protein ICW40_00770 [Actinotalea ferrariae]|uniref:hypothetical protein n=1 Tax=Actinotalea ferrariae TaxID=1386098 RepID=UPI001C8B8C30|nr:hypothetical protein [Actinotalea ferrariae]MBX9243340.1 hypothetical protein [Actinotalea ferrariae]
MPLDPRTEQAVRALWDVGTRNGRPPAPVPEADPWEDDDPLDPARGWLPVELPGVPSVVVRLHRDGEDLVVVEDVVELDVPRRDTVRVVEELLTGGARRRHRARGALGQLLAIVLHNPQPSELVVTVHDDDPEVPPRTYDAPVVLGTMTSGWVLTLPTVDGERTTPS